MAREREGGERGRGYTGGWRSERPGYGRGHWGVEEQEGWRGPGEGPGFRQAPRPGGAFRQGSAGGQIPGEYRQWTPEPERGRGRGQPGSSELVGFRGPDADRDRSGHRRSLAERGPHAGRGPKNYRRSDERIWAELCDRLTADPGIDASDVEVEVKEGRIILRGTVPDRRTKHRAEDLADEMLGAVEVDNQLRVRH